MLEGPLEPEGEVAEGGVVLAQHAHHLLGLGGLREGGEAPQVAVDGGDLTAVALEERLLPALDDEPRDLRREEAPEPADPLDLAPPGPPPWPRARRFQAASSRRLGLDGVVVALDPDERPDAGQQLGLLERLGEEVVGTGLDRLELLLGYRWR